MRHISLIKMKNILKKNSYNSTSARQIIQLKILEDFKKDIDSNKLVVANFNTPLSTIDLPKNIHKDTVSLNNTLDQMDFTDKYRTFHPKEANYTLFSKHMEHFKR